MFFQWLRDAVFSRFHSTSFTEALKTMSLSGEDYLFAKGAWLELVMGFNHQIFAIWDEQIQGAADEQPTSYNLHLPYEHKMHNPLVGSCHDPCTSLIDFSETLIASGLFKAVKAVTDYTTSGITSSPPNFPLQRKLNNNAA